MDKRLLLGIGIFLVLVLGLISLSVTADVNAQTILNNDSNIPVSTVYYQLELTGLNLSNSYDWTYDNETNTTTMKNITHTVDYECDIRTGNDSQVANGYTSNLTDIISINQTLNTTLTNGLHNLTLECLYYINTTNMTSMASGGEYGLNSTSNATVIDALLVLSSRNMTTYKEIFIDVTAPFITLLNNSIVLQNNTAYVNLTVTDISYVECVLNTSVQGINFNATAAGNTTTTVFSIPLNVTAGNHTINISCQDRFLNRNTTGYILHVSSENVTNTTNTTNQTQESPFFEIKVSKPELGLGEIGYYTINATNGSNVSLTICPIATGWVQCYMVPAFVNETFPKTQALMYTNKTGRYIIEGVMHYKNVTITRNITYETKNTLTAVITPSQTKGVVGDTITYNTSATSGIAPYTYKWTMHDGTRFTGPGAYKKYNIAGTYRVNLTVNDSTGNNYSTYDDIVIKNQYLLTVIVTDKKTNGRLSGATVQVDEDVLETNSNGIVSITRPQGSYDITVSRDNYKSYSEDISLDAAETLYVNLSFYDIIPPKITLLTDDGTVLNKNAVDLKFKAEDASSIACSLYIAQANSSWYTLKDSGDNLVTNTVYTFELRDLTDGAYKWKMECTDVESNKAYSEERNFIVSDGSVTVALQSSGQVSDSINKALDTMEKLSGDESAVADALSIRTDLKYLLDRINNLDRDIHDLSYRRDLDEEGRLEAQKNLTNTIEYLKNNTPIGLSVKESKTFVKYVRDEDLEALIGEYIAIKNMNLDKRALFESIKSIQSKAVISTRVRNVDLYYLSGEVREITVVSKDIQIVKPEDELSLRNSNSVTFIEMIPKTVCQSAEQLHMLNKRYTVLKDDPIIEYPSDTGSIIYYMDGKIDVEEFQYTDTVLIDKNIGSVKSTTGLFVFNLDDISSISDIHLDGRGVMIILIVLLLLFYIVVNFDIIERLRGINIGFMKLGSKKKISFIRVLVNDAVDYLKTEDYDKAALIYHEIKLSYEESNVYVRKQVYDESFDLCNQLDLTYAMKVLEKVEYYIRIQDRNSAIIEFQKLESTYNRLSEPYQAKISERFKMVVGLIKI